MQYDISNEIILLRFFDDTLEMQETSARDAYRHRLFFFVHHMSRKKSEA